MVGFQLLCLNWSVSEVKVWKTGKFMKKAIKIKKSRVKFTMFLWEFFECFSKKHYRMLNITFHSLLRYLSLWSFFLQPHKFWLKFASHLPMNFGLKETKNTLKFEQIVPLLGERSESEPNLLQRGMGFWRRSIFLLFWGSEWNENASMPLWFAEGVSYFFYGFLMEGMKFWKPADT